MRTREAAGTARGLIGRRWGRAAYPADPERLARKLLGAVLVRVLADGTVLAGRIVETEAYCGVIDAASHAYRGRRTARNGSMYERAGTAYVYFTYGMHFCMNVVCGREGTPLAVLIRALEPLVGIEKMRTLRGVHPGRAIREVRVVRDTELCSGPARLCQALQITRAQDGVDLVTGNGLFVADPAKGSGLGVVRARDVARTARIGVSYAGEWADRPLRFVVAGSGHVSRAVRIGRGGKLGKGGRASGKIGRGSERGATAGGGG